MTSSYVPFIRATSKSRKAARSPSPRLQCEPTSSMWTDMSILQCYMTIWTHSSRSAAVGIRWHQRTATSSSQRMKPAALFYTQQHHKRNRSTFSEWFLSSWMVAWQNLHQPISHRSASARLKDLSVQLNLTSKISRRMSMAWASILFSWVLLRCTWQHMSMSTIPLHWTNIHLELNHFASTKIPLDDDELWSKMHTRCDLSEHEQILNKERRDWFGGCELVCTIFKFSDLIWKSSSIWSWYEVDTWLKWKQGITVVLWASRWYIVDRGGPSVRSTY